MLSPCHHIFKMIFYLCCSQCLWVFLMCMAAPWMARIRCATDTLGAHKKQQISKIIRDSSSCFLLVLVIHNAQINIMNIHISMELFTTVLNGLDGLLFHFFVKNDVPKNSKLECKVCCSIVKQIEMQLGRYIVKVNQVCQWSIVNAHTFSIGHWAWIRWPKSISNHRYNCAEATMQWLQRCENYGWNQN